jgi:hypothetical protein
LSTKEVVPVRTARIEVPWKDRLAEPLPRDHIVQLYRDDDALIEALVLFVGVGLGKGDAVVLVATPDHLRAIDARLASAGLDLEGPRRWGQLTVMDAPAVLAGLMVEGRPEPGLFNVLVRSLLDKASAGGRHVRVFGEMVDLLWKTDVAAAVRLEELWNAVVAKRGISLLCAYALGARRPDLPAELRRLHSRLVPLEAYA